MALCDDPDCKQCYPNGALVEDEAEVQVTRRITPLPPPQSYGGGGGGGGGSGGGSAESAGGVIAFIVIALVVIGLLSSASSGCSTKSTQPTSWSPR